jgi:predicted NUDIX family NTP pyrophosphohydrolase
MSMSKISAGLLMYRIRDRRLEVFLVHPGGPFFKKREDIWSIPKGERHDEEDLLTCAKREFLEETGIDSGQARMTELGSVTHNNKAVYCWAFENNLSDEEIKKIFKSNPSKFGWPENDAGKFMDLETAHTKIFPGQKPFLSRLTVFLNRPGFSGQDT